MFPPPAPLTENRLIAAEVWLYPVTGALSIVDWLWQAVTSNTALSHPVNDTAVFQAFSLHIRFMATPSPYSSTTNGELSNSHWRINACRSWGS